jgi:phosphatidylinositol-3-phosphatase
VAILDGVQRLLYAILAVLAVAGLVACGSQGTPPPASGSSAPLDGLVTASGGTSAGTVRPPGASHTPAGRPDHVLVAIFENQAYASLAGNAQAPYFNALMRSSAVLTNAHGVTHPSQPNYLALFSGSTQGITDDHCLTPWTDRANLARQLLDAGLTFAGYSEDMPAPGYTGCVHAGYAAKHNPWVHFSNVPATANQPFSAFPADPSQLPTVGFVVPNLCNDMHDCGVAVGDSWAKAHLESYRAWAQTHNSLLIVTFDENDGAAGNQILTLVAGAGVRPARYGQLVTHYGVLRTIEDLYGLSPLGEARSASPITDIRD